MLGIIILSLIFGCYMGWNIARSGIKDNVERAKNLEDFKRLEKIE